MKVTNALVTYTDLSTMGLAVKGTPITGARIATKQFIIANYYVDETASPFAGYTSLRCPPYQTILANPLSSCNEYRIENNTEVTIGVSWYDCYGVYQSDPNVGSGNQFYFCANVIYGPIEIGGGSLFNVGSCTTTTTTTTTILNCNLDGTAVYVTP